MMEAILSAKIFETIYYLKFASAMGLYCETVSALGDFGMRMRVFAL